MKIKFVNGPKAGKETNLILPEISIGRDDGNILRLPTEGVSRIHAIIKQVDDEKWVIIDNHSTNGVKVNGTRISGEQQIFENDTIEIGGQRMEISNLTLAQSKVIFTPIADGANNDAPKSSDSLGPQVAPGLGEIKQATHETSANVKEEASSLDMSQKLLDDLTAGKSLFEIPEPKTKTDNNKEAATEFANLTAPNKKHFSKKFYLIVIACVLLMVVAVPLGDALKPKAAKKTNANSNNLILHYEKTEYSRDNVFRVEIKINKEKATFVIDDLKTGRHIHPITISNPTALDILKSRIKNSGIAAVVKSDLDQGASSIERRLILISGGKILDFVANGERLPSAFEDVETAIKDFAESCGQQTISLSSEELLKQAEDSYYKANDLFDNREAKSSNLREAIMRYTIAVENLKQFNPPPAILKDAQKKLKTAEELRKRIEQELAVEYQRHLKSRNFTSLKKVIKDQMELFDVDSKKYDKAKQNLFKVEMIIRRSK